MSHTPHELAEELPDLADRIHGLKQTDARFAKMTEDYHALNRQIHRAESDVEPMDDLALETLKKKRLALLDELKSLLAAA